MIERNFSFIAILLLLVFVSCKKEPRPKLQPEPIPPDVIPTSGTRSELTKDSIYLYAKQVYHWNEALPSYTSFNPRKYTAGTSDLINYEKELFDITQIKINPLTNKPFEFLASSSGANSGEPKYSYIDDKTSQNPTVYIPGLENVVDLEGIGNDIGIGISAIGSNSSYEVRIKYISLGSPASKTSLSRGDVINKFNGTSVGTNFNAESNFVDNAMAGASVTLEGWKKDGTPFNLTLAKTTYNSNPIYKDTVIISSGKKIGYFAFARFSNEENSVPVLNQVFSKFSAAGITDLVVDLRYNGGGYVSTAEYLTNLIAPSGLDGNVMFKEKFNTMMQTGKATILENQPLLDGSGNLQYSGGKIVTYADFDYSEAANTKHFHKTGNLFLPISANIIFLISGSTASASEMIINNLKPYMSNIRLIGKTSYGKPVGFFPVTIENKYDVYFAMFTNINSAGDTDFFAGFTPNANLADPVSKDFGDPQEAYFASAIAYITKGSFTATSYVPNTVSIRGKSVSISSLEVRDVVKDVSFKGMIKTDFKLKSK